MKQEMPDRLFISKANVIVSRDPDCGHTFQSLAQLFAMRQI